MCTVLLPPGVYPIALKKYMNINVNINIHIVKTVLLQYTSSCLTNPFIDL